MCSGEWNGCCIPRPCAVEICRAEPFPQPCSDPPPINCPPDIPGWQVPISCAPKCPPSCAPQPCRPGPEICISRPCVEDCRPKPPRPPQPPWFGCWPRPPQPCRPPKPPKPPGPCCPPQPPRPPRPDCCTPNYPSWSCCDTPVRPCPEPPRQEYFASFREFRIAQLVESLNQVFGCRG